MSNGIWKKYEKTKRDVHEEGKASYDRLFEDLKDSGKSWIIASDYGICQDELCGEFLPYNGIDAGDIYVYYTNQDDIMVPEFYMKISEVTDGLTNKERNIITISGFSLDYSCLDSKYFPVVIEKLQEIDKVKNEYYIKELENRYAECQRLESIMEKDVFTEKDLLFLYYMACKRGHLAALSKVKERNIQQDFDGLSDNNKVTFFLHIRDTYFVQQLSITSKKVIMLLAQKLCLKPLLQTTDDIINDKEYIMSLVQNFLECENLREGYGIFELTKYLPSKYKIDIDVLKLLISQYKIDIIDNIHMWLRSDSVGTMRLKDSNFSYQLIDLYMHFLMKNEKVYCETSLLWSFPDNILMGIENHILFGPEPTEKREYLKGKSMKAIQRQKSKILYYRNQIKNTSFNRE